MFETEIEKVKTASANNVLKDLSASVTNVTSNEDKSTTIEEKAVENKPDIKLSNKKKTTVQDKSVSEIKLKTECKNRKIAT